MRAITRFSLRVPVGKAFQVFSDVQNPASRVVVIQEGGEINRGQITALARKIKTPASVEIQLVTKTRGIVGVTQKRAWDLLFPPVTAYIIKILSHFTFDRISVDEGVARTWLKVVKHFNSYEPGPIDCEAHFLSWLQFIALNEARKMYHEQVKWFSRHPIWISGLDRGEQESYMPVDASGDPAVLAMEKDQAAKDARFVQHRVGFDLFLLELSFEKLPERERDILLAIDHNGKTYGEIARSQGVKMPALKSLIFRARRKVMQMFGSFRNQVHARPLHPGEVRRIEAHQGALLKILKMSFEG